MAPKTKQAVNPHRVQGISEQKYLVFRLSEQINLSVFGLGLRYKLFFSTGVRIRQIGISQYVKIALQEKICRGPIYTRVDS